MNHPVQLIVGLGNPGQQYQHTRHNAGEAFIEELCRRHNCSLSDTPKFFGLSARTTIAGQDIRLLVPTTYMNRSGQAVAAISQFYKIAPENILIAHDELDINPGLARLKRGGGHGGHNGLRDIISSLGNNKNFGRLRLGIGHPGNAKEVANFVLTKAPASEYQLTEQAIDQAAECLPMIISGDWEKAMNTLHTRTP